MKQLALYKSEMSKYLIQNPEICKTAFFLINRNNDLDSVC